jgi:hypothetical protein
MHEERPVGFEGCLQGRIAPQCDMILFHIRISTFADWLRTQKYFATVVVDAADANASRSSLSIIPERRRFNGKSKLSLNDTRKLLYHSSQSCHRDMPKSLHRAAMMPAAGA